MLKCDGISQKAIIANLLPSLKAEEFSKLVTIWQSYLQNTVAPFLLTVAIFAPP